MSVYRTLNYLIFCLFCLSMILPVRVYSQENTEPQSSEDWYAKGRQKLESETGIDGGGAKLWLEFAKQSLSENLTAKILEDVLGQGELPLSEFFDKLPPATIKREVINDLKNIYNEEVSKQLKIAIDSFNNEIEKKDSKHKVDAYLKLIDTYLVMNKEQEAIDAYEKCQELGFEGTTLSTDEFKDISHRIAKVYWKGDVKSKKKYKDMEAELVGSDTHFTCEFKKELSFTEAIVNFLPTEKELSSKDLAKHFIVIVYLPGEGKATSVKLSNEITLNKDKNKIRRTIPPGDYKVVIKIPKLNIKDENRIPFRINLNGEYILTAPFRQRDTRIILNELMSEKQEIQKPQPIEIICKDGTFMKYNILRNTSIATGNYTVTIQSSIKLYPEQVYNLSFEPAPPIPSPKWWWIIAIAIASVISIFSTSILQ